jgi:hypothetical protein
MNYSYNKLQNTGMDTTETDGNIGSELGAGVKRYQWPNMNKQ